MTDLFRWHLAEEVEHRTVAYDLFEHLCQNQFGFFISRQALMAVVIPVIVKVVADSFRHIAKQDEKAKQLSQHSWIRLLMMLENAGRENDHVPTVRLLIQSIVRWTSPTFHPINEGDTQQALDRLAQSPAAQAAVGRN